MACRSRSSMLTNAGAVAVLTLRSLSLVDADAAAAALVAHAMLSAMLAHEAPPALLARSPLPQMLADAAPPAVFAGPSLSFMHTNAASAAVRAPRFDAPVLALWHRAPRASCPARSHSCMAAAASGRTNCNVRSRSTRGKSCRRQQHSDMRSNTDPHIANDTNTWSTPLLRPQSLMSRAHY